MNLTSILFFAVFSNLDNFIIGISYGIKKIRVTSASYFIIALITFIGTALSMLLGKSISRFIPVTAANVIGGMMIMGMGIYAFILYIRTRKDHASSEDSWPVKNPEKYDKNHNQVITYNETFSLGIALTINNIGLGIGASISGLSVLPTAVASFLFSVIFMLLGNHLGNCVLSKLIGKYAEPVAAICMIALGIWEILF